MQRFPETEALGRGEAEAIKLAKEINADLLLTDDRKARAAATNLGINTVGLLGVVVQARLSGHIHSARALIEVIETKGGLYLSDTVKAEALKLAGEVGQRNFWLARLPSVRKLSPTFGTRFSGISKANSTEALFARGYQES